MTKELFIEIINKYVPDGEEIAVGGWWYKSDVEDFEEREMTAEQWSRFVHWFEKYQDNSFDYDEALSYAFGAN